MGMNERNSEDIATQPGSPDGHQNSNIDSALKYTRRQVSATDSEFPNAEFNRLVTGVSVMTSMSVDVAEARWEALLSMIETERAARTADHQELRAALAELKMSQSRYEQDTSLEEFRCEIEEKLVAIGKSCEDHIKERMSHMTAPIFASDLKEFENKLLELETRMSDQLASTLKLVDDTLLNVAQSLENIKKDVNAPRPSNELLDDQNVSWADPLVPSQKTDTAPRSAGRPCGRHYASSALNRRADSTPVLMARSGDTPRNGDSATERQSATKLAPFPSVLLQTQAMPVSRPTMSPRTSLSDQRTAASTVQARPAQLCTHNAVGLVAPTRQLCSPLNGCRQNR